MTAPVGPAPGPVRRRRAGLSVLGPAVVLALLALAALFPAAFALGADPLDCDLSRSLDPPSRAHPAGLSLFGCDYLAETVYAARASPG